MKARPQLNNFDDVVAQFDFIRRKKQEHFVCLSMDSANRVIRRRVVTKGLVNMVPTHPRELFAGPVTDRATYVIVAHNHCSEIARPSKGDIETTQQLVAAGILLGIEVKDHIIVTRDAYFSFHHNSLL